MISKLEQYTICVTNSPGVYRTCKNLGLESEYLKFALGYHPKKAIIHWYNGNSLNMDRLLEIDCFFSINNNMVNAKVRNMYHAIPANRILVESDGPYSKVNGKKYTPEMLLAAYQNIAIFYDNPELIKTVFENFKTLLTT